jgi:hypothetical protein
VNKGFRIALGFAYSSHISLGGVYRNQRGN